MGEYQGSITSETVAYYNKIRNGRVGKIVRLVEGRRADWNQSWTVAEDEAEMDKTYKLLQRAKSRLLREVGEDFYKEYYRLGELHLYYLLATQPKKED